MRNTRPDPAGESPRASTGRVLVVEDEPALQRALEINLRARGYQVSSSADGQTALAEAARRPPDAVLLDLGLPDMDGSEVIRRLRVWTAVPVLVLSGRAGSGDKIGALDAGADDYVTKPFSMEELLARLRALLRRDAQPSSRQVFTIGHCTIDLSARTVVRRPDDEPASDGSDPDGSAPDASAVPARLTRTEWRMLEVLLRSPGQLVSSGRLLSELWGAGAEDRTYYLRFHMAGLRRKLEDDPPRPRHLLTEPGLGYRYQS
ncbi:MAG: response regulator transcription factor [Streptosporangiaceae bacterium]